MSILRYIAVRVVEEETNGSRPDEMWCRSSVVEPLEAERDELIGTTHELREQLAVMTAERDALKAFKTFVHKRFDQIGVPKEFPDGKHSKEGCRIGDRIDWLEAEWKGCWKAAMDGAEQRALAATGGVLAGDTRPTADQLREVWDGEASMFDALLAMFNRCGLVRP